MPAPAASARSRIQIARARGAQVIATCSQRNAELRQLVRRPSTSSPMTARRSKSGARCRCGVRHHGRRRPRRSYEVLKRGGTDGVPVAEPYHRSRRRIRRHRDTGARFCRGKDILESLLNMVADGALRVFDRADAADHGIPARAGILADRPRARQDRACSCARPTDTDRMHDARAHMTAWSSRRR